MGYIILYNNGKCIRLDKSRRSELSLDFFIKDLILDDYVIIKRTCNFKIIDKKYIEKYAGILLIKKDNFNYDNFNNWIKWIKQNITFKYLSVPFPNFDPFSKIKEIL